MLRSDAPRIDPKRRQGLDYKKKQFAQPSFKQLEYPFRLNFYQIPPTAEITLEQFEQWAIDRLRSEARTIPCILENNADCLRQSWLSLKPVHSGINHIKKRHRILSRS